MQLLRATLGLLAVFFGHFFGRAVVRVRRERQPIYKTYSWGLRTVAALLAVLWRGLDRVSLVTLAAVALSFAAGAYSERHPAKHDELEKVMFPKDEPPPGSDRGDS